MIQIETQSDSIVIRIREKGSFPSGTALFDPARRSHDTPESDRARLGRGGDGRLAAPESRKVRASPRQEPESALDEPAESTAQEPVPEQPKSRIDLIREEIEGA